MKNSWNTKIRICKVNNMTWKDEIKKDAPDKVTYDTAKMRNKLTQLKRYRESLIGKKFTQIENNRLLNMVLDIVNDYEGRQKSILEKECPQCKGKGCEHCNYKGYHLKNRRDQVNNMTRCNNLDGWFDTKSKELDEAEKKTKKDFVTGGKK